MAFVDVYGEESTGTDAYADIDVVDEGKLAALQSLMPPGVSWTRDADAELTKLERALAYEPSRIKKRAADLIEEADPRTTTEMIDDWERVYGLPDECAQPTTLVGRRAALLGKVRGALSPTVANITSIASQLGYEIGITEVTHSQMFSCTSPCNAPLYTRQWMYLWQVATWPGETDDELECVLDSLMPLHTVLDLKFISKDWTSHHAAEANTWQGIAWSPELGLFVAVSGNGTNRVMTSPDGERWTARTSAEANNWRAVCWSSTLEKFVAVASDGTNRVMTSIDGVTWLPFAAASASTWLSVVWVDELSLFVAVGTGCCMTSPDGETWTSRTVPSAGGEIWRHVAWSPSLNLLVAVASLGTERLITSPNGVTWTNRTPAEANQWWSVAWSPTLEVFLAVADSGSNRVMMSSNGITWTSASIDANSWRRVIWVDEQECFIALAADGTHRVAVSYDGEEWTGYSAAEANTWGRIVWAPELSKLVAISSDGTHRVMTSP